MASLQIFPNEVTKTQDVQNTQTYISLQSIQQWAPTTLTSVPIDYKQESASNTNVQGSNLSTTATSYAAIPQYSFNFTPNNSLCELSFSLTLTGQGYIAVYINGQVTNQIPFNFSTANSLTFSAKEQLSVTSNKINLAWRASTGTITLTCGKGNNFYNRLQVINFNSQNSSGV